ncbi:GDSL-type esterase/lipase family protein [Armatimonas rosea]|uniref:Lysophospholipase L1-like esterase n=1 Tax=Armatimonas rosea TaxID=685828 RepID=A0A7W9SMJ3_ARMRO|nr:GDSL-type esterase/lipase family protein [Armatimonas rosea]MBB6049391.1 lysophospholipase L1-like esterase [Armatimonas rosea]
MRPWFYLALGSLLSGCTPRNPAPLPLLQLHNGGMEQGTDAPTDWGGDWVGYKRHALSRDTQVKHSGSASLRFQLTPRDHERTLEQLVVGGAGRSVVLSGWLKTEGALRVQVGVLPYGSRGTALAAPAFFMVEKPTGWTHFSQPLTLPENALSFSVALRAAGAGAVWLDDVQLSGERVETVPSDPLTVLPPQHQEPERPYPGTHLPTWYEVHQALKAQARSATPNIVFLGDSITKRWRLDGSDEWERFFAPLGALNLGLEGDRTSQVLWRIQDGTLAGLHPKLVVLAVGANNLIRDTYPPERVAAGVLACVRAVERACPGTKVLVVGIFPTEKSATHPIRARIQQTNALLAAQLPHFLELGKDFLEPDGTLSDRLFPDQIHPNAAGYRLYRERLLPKIQSLVK